MRHFWVRCLTTEPAAPNNLDRPLYPWGATREAFQRHFQVAVLMTQLREDRFREKKDRGCTRHGRKILPGPPSPLDLASSVNDPSFS